MRLKLSLVPTFIVAIGITLLAGCGGGGNAGSTTPQVNDLSETLEIDTGEGFNPLESDTNPDLARDIQAFGPIANYFGNATFTFNFTGIAGLYLLAVTWDADSIVTLDDGSHVLFGLGNFGSIDADAVVSESGTRTIFCFNSNETDYYCSIDFGNDDSVALLFKGRKASSDSQVRFAQIGVMEFCNAETTTATCISEVIATPDGDAALQVYTQNPTAESTETNHPNPINNLYVDYYLNYLDQASNDSTQVERTANVAVNTVFDKIAELKKTLEQ